MNESQLRAFQDKIRDRIPGTIWLFDFADFKRFNLHLGYEEGNRAVTEFDRLLKDVFADPDYSHRVAGDKWMVFQKSFSLPPVQKLLEDLAKDYQKEVGWECVGLSKEGVTKEAAEKKMNTISLRARAGYKPIDMFEPMESVIDHLAEYIHLGEVGVPENMTSIPIKKRSSFVAAHDITTDPHCPFCLGSSFANGEGTTIGFAGECRECGALCRFTFF